MADEGTTAAADPEDAEQGAGQVVAAVADRAKRARRGPERAGGGAKEALTSAPPRGHGAVGGHGGEVNFTPGRREKNDSHHRFTLQSTAERAQFFGRPCASR